MMKSNTRPLRRLYNSLDTSSSCLSCQWRSFTTTYRRDALAQKKSTPQTQIPSKTPQLSSHPADSSLANAPRAYGKAIEQFDPKPLNRPIGVPNPPQEGENSGIDLRTRREKYNDWQNVDKNRAARKQITTKLSTPYFREWSNMRHHKGKSFLCPPRLFKSSFALYFPNMVGRTLDPSHRTSRNSLPPSTTPILRTKISIISIFAERWAENQCSTFTSSTQNPALQALLAANPNVLQRVYINVEENWLKAKIQDIFRPWFRKTIEKAMWSRYFIVRKGLDMELTDAIGMLNSRVGYTYLVDGECRIRWAGSGNADVGEKEGLVKGVKFLLDECGGKSKVVQGEKDGLSEDVKKVVI